MTDLKAVPGTVGKLTRNFHDLVITGKNLDKVKKKLTAVNKSVSWSIKQCKKKIEKNHERLQKSIADGDIMEESRLEAKDREFMEEFKALQAQLKVEYWDENEDGSLTVPAGFWSVCEKIDDDEHLNKEVKYVDLPVVDGKSPRGYQVEAVTNALKYQRSSIVSPTGSGKSLMIAMLAYPFVKAGKRVCVIEPTIELVTQTKDFLSKYMPNISGLGGKFKFKLGNDILVTTINSAVKHIDMYDVVIIDEFQHSAADTYAYASLLATKARYFYGLTACPIRADGLSIGIHASCGPVVFERDTKWGIEIGALSGVKTAMVEVKGLSMLPEGMNAQRAYSYVTNSGKYKKTVYDLAKQSLDSGRRTLVIFKTVQAGLAFKEYCTSQGLEFDVASSEFRNPLYQFKKKETNLLVSNSGLMAEGVDVPSIDCVITCIQNSSENITRQVMGRGLRPSDGKSHLVFFDVYTNNFNQFAVAAINRRKIYHSNGCEVREVVR